jgi:acetoin utilization deacetylase AcuC-like enzyme
MIDTELQIDDFPALTDLDTGARVPTVWDPRYVTTAAPLTSTTKAGRVIEARRADLAIVQPPDIALSDVWTHIAQWHHPLYVRAVATGTPRRLAMSQGFEWSPAFAESVARIWYGQHLSQQLAHVLGRAVLHPVSGAHHARPDRGSGFCTFNYVVAALAAIKRDRPQANLAVIDLDAHYGDGTADFAAAHPALRLALFDIAGAGRPVAPIIRPRVRTSGVTTPEEYRKALLLLPGFLRANAITDAVYLAGMDPYEHDVVGGIPGVDADFLAQRDRYVLRALAAHGVATVVNFAGGYVPDRVVELHGGTITAMQQIARGWTPPSLPELADQ